MWPNPTPQNFDFNEFKFTLSEVASLVTAFLGKWFLEEDFLSFTLYSRYVKLRPLPPLRLYLSPGDHGFNKLKLPYIKMLPTKFQIS